MKHVKALAIKFVSCLVLLSLVLGGLYGISFGDIFTISLVLGVASYVIGDLIILPRTNNTVATIADFGMALLVIYVLCDNLTPLENLFVPSLIAAAGTALFEYFFHKYVYNTVLSSNDRERQRPLQGNLQYQTETSEELTPVRPDVREDDDIL